MATQTEKRVTYVDKGLVFVVKNPNGVRLVIGDTPFRYPGGGVQ